MKALTRSTLACGLASLLTLAAQAGSAGQLDTYLSKLAKAGRFNGVVLVARDHEVVFEKAFGYQDINSRTPMTLDSCFNLASISKPLTATAILMLYEQELLDLDEDISEYLPDFAYEGITVRHLLTHTSGLPDYIELAEEHWDNETTFSNADIPGLLAEHGSELAFSPGSQYDYSNTGYALLALIVARVTQEDFPVWMQNHLFKPAGMKKAYVLNPKNIYSKVPCRVSAYTRETGSERLVPDKLGYLDGIFGDGGVVASARDLFAFDQALYDEKLVSDETLQETFKSEQAGGKDTGYGLGWAVYEDYVYHGGAWEGFQHYFTRYYQQGNTSVILSSVDNENNDDIHATLEASLTEE